jgi:AcrR family transcriptional regulator
MATSKTAAHTNKGERAREEIVLAAKRLFGTNGYQATSVQQIADAIGRSQSAVMHHFPTKIDIFSAVLSAMVAENDRIRASYNAPQANALDRLMNHFHANYRWGVESEFHAQIMTGLFNFATYDESFNRLYTSVVATARGRLLELLHAGSREKLFALPSDPERSAEILHDALLGFLITVVASRRLPHTKARQLAKWQALVAAITGHETKDYLPS